MKLKKAIYITIGCIGLALGAVGAVLPLLPTVPFLLLAAFCFGNSSERLNNWGKSTKQREINYAVPGNGICRRITRR